MVFCRARVPVFVECLPVERLGFSVVPFPYEQATHAADGLNGARVVLHAARSL